MQGYTLTSLASCVCAVDSCVWVEKTSPCDRDRNPAFSLCHGPSPWTKSNKISWISQFFYNKVHTENMWFCICTTVTIYDDEEKEQFQTQNNLKIRDTPINQQVSSFQNDLSLTKKYILTCRANRPSSSPPFPVTSPCRSSLFWICHAASCQTRHRCLPLDWKRHTDRFSSIWLELMPDSNMMVLSFFFCFNSTEHLYFFVEPNEGHLLFWPQNQTWVWVWLKNLNQCTHKDNTVCGLLITSKDQRTFQTQLEESSLLHFFLAGSSCDLD